MPDGHEPAGNIHEIPSSKKPVPPPPPGPPSLKDDPNQSDGLRGIEWSIDDEGPVESEIQKEWARLDLVYPQTFLAEKCLLPLVGRGRKTAMQIAIDAAKHGFDKKALDIAASTQLHNERVAVAIRNEGEYKIAEYLCHKQDAHPWTSYTSLYKNVSRVRSNPMLFHEFDCDVAHRA